MLRATGATPRQVLLLASGEAVILSAVSVALGLPLGAFLAEQVTALDLGPQAGFSQAFTVHYPVGVMVRTALLVLVAAQVAAVVASRHALRTRPADALSEATTEGRPVGRLRIASGIVALVSTVGFAGLLAAADLNEDVAVLVAFAIMLLTLVTVGLLAPLLLRGVTSALRTALSGLVRRGSGLAIANAAFFHRRFSGVAGPLLLGLALAGTTGSLQLYYNVENADAEFERVASHTSDFVVRLADDTDRFGEGALRQVAELPAVEGAVSSTYRAVEVTDPAGRPLQGHPYRDEPDGTPRAMVVFGDPAGTVDLGLVDGTFDPEDPDAVAVHAFYAEDHDLSVGSVLRLRGRGPSAEERELRVTGVYTGGYLRGSSVGLGSAAAGDLVRGSALGTSIMIGQLEDHGGDLREELERMFPPVREGGPFMVLDRAELWQSMWDEHAERNRYGTVTFLAISAIVMLAGVNGMAVWQFDRGGEFANLRLLGMRWRQIHRMVAAETLLTTVIVLVLALLASWWTGFALTMQNPSHGLRLTPQLVPVGTLGVLGGGGLLLALIGSSVVVHRIRRSGGG